MTNCVKRTIGGAGLVDFFLARLRLLHGFGKVDGRVGKLLKHRVGTFADRLAVMPVNGLVDRIAGRQGNLNLAVENKPELVESVVVHRVADDDGQFAIVLRQRYSDVLPRDGLGHQFNHGGGDDDFGEVDVVQIVLLGHRPHHVLARGVARFNERLGQLDGLLAGHLLGFGQLLGANDPSADENLCEIALTFGHERLRVASGQGSADCARRKRRAEHRIS